MSPDLKRGCELCSRYRLWQALAPKPDDCPDLRRLWRAARDKRQFGQARQVAYDYWLAKTGGRK